MAITVNNDALQPQDKPQPQQSQGFQGSGFTNLNRVVQANQQNRLGNTVQQGFNNVAADTSNNIQKGRQDFQQQTANAMQPYQGGSEFINQTIANPTDINSNSGTLNRFRQIASGQYAGPQNLSNQQALSGNVQNVQSLANMTNNPGGREALLQTFIQNPNYSGGQRQLDSLLLGSTGGKQLASLKGVAAQTGRQFSNAQQEATGQAQANQQLATDLGQQANSQLMTEQQNQDTALQAQLANTQQSEIDKKSQLDALKANLEQGQLTEDQVQQLGLSRSSLDPTQSLYYGEGNPLDQVKLNYSAAPTSISDVITADQTARMNALNKLSGNATDVYDPNNVGKWQASNADASALQQNAQDYADKEKRAEAESAAYTNYANVYDPYQSMFSNNTQDVYKNNPAYQQVMDARQQLENFYGSGQGLAGGEDLKTALQTSPGLIDPEAFRTKIVNREKGDVNPILQRLAGRLNILPNTPTT